MTALQSPCPTSFPASLPAVALSPPSPCLTALDLTLLTSLDSLRLHLSAFRVSVDSRLQDWDASRQQQQHDCLRLISAMRDELQERQHEMEREQTQRWQRLRRSLRGLHEPALPLPHSREEQAAASEAAVSEERVKAMIAEGLAKAMQTTMATLSSRHDAVVDRLQQRITQLEEQLKQQQEQQAAVANAAAAATAAVSAPPASTASLHLSPSQHPRHASHSLSLLHYPPRSLSPSSASALSPAAAASFLSSSPSASAGPARSSLKKNVRFNEELKARLFLDTDEREEEEKQPEEQKETEEDEFVFAFPVASTSAVSAPLPSFPSYSTAAIFQPRRGAAPSAPAVSEAQLPMSPVAAGLTYSYGQDGQEQEGEGEAVKEEKMEERSDAAHASVSEKAVSAEAEERQRAVEEEQDDEEEAEEPLALTDLTTLDAEGEKPAEAAAEEHKLRLPEAQPDSHKAGATLADESSDDSSDDEAAPALPPPSSSWSLPALPAAVAVKSSLAIRADRPVSRLTDDSDKLVSILHPVLPPRAADSQQDKELQLQHRGRQHEHEQDSDSEVVLELEPSRLSTGMTSAELALEIAEESSSGSGSDDDDDDDVLLIRG